MDATTFRSGDITGIRTLILLQAVVCIVVGTLLVALPVASITTVVLLLGGYWMLRGLAAVGHAYAEPTRWAGKGTVAVLHIVAGLLVLQAPLFGAFPIGMSIVLFLGAQAMVSGAIEVAMGVRRETPPLSILGLVNILLGAVLLVYPAVIVAIEVLPLSLGLVAIVGGMLAVYAAIRLPAPRGARTQWYARS